MATNVTKATKATKATEDNTIVKLVERFFKYEKNPFITNEQMVIFYQTLLNFARKRGMCTQEFNRWFLNGCNLGFYNRPHDDDKLDFLSSNQVIYLTPSGKMINIDEVKSILGFYNQHSGEIDKCGLDYIPVSECKYSRVNGKLVECIN